MDRNIVNIIKIYAVFTKIINYDIILWYYNIDIDILL